MEKSKKIISIILIICALSALCAVGAVSVSADDVVFYYDPDYFISDSGRIGGFQYSNSSLGFYRSFSKSYSGDAVGVFLSNSDPKLCGIALISTNPDYVKIRWSNASGNTGPSNTYTVDGNSVYFTVSYTTSTGGNNVVPYCDILPSYTYTSSLSNDDLFDIVVSLTGFSFTPPEPDPEPSDPSSEGGSLLEGFTWAQNIGYYASFSPLLDSSTLEPTYLSTTRFSSMPYDQITDLKFQTPSSSNGCALIEGQKTDYSDILVDHTVIYGVAAMLLTSPNFKLDQSTLSPDFDATIFLASGDDPSASGYTQVDASTVGFDSYTVRVWTLDYNEWSRIVMVRFYFLFEEGVGTATYPNDTISVQFKSTALHTHEWYCTPFDFRLQYALRDSSSDPLPDSVANYNPATGSPTSNGGYNTSGSSVTTDLNEEFNWSKELFNAVDITVTPIFDQLDGMYNNNVSLAGLDTLYTALSYSGVGGTITLPSATIPFGDMQLHLWNEHIIPFNEYITQIPQIYKVIISFLLIGGGFFACSAIFWKFFKQVFFGDVSNERF